MNVYAARQRLDNGNWEYTVKNSQGTFALGYCRAYRVWKPADMLFTSVAYAEAEADKLNAKYAPYEKKFHSGGHASAAEAEACYREYLLDHELRFADRPNDNEQHRCAVCGEWTQWAGWLTGDNHHFWHLCQKHMTRDAVASIFHGAIKAWGT